MVDNYTLEQQELLYKELNKKLKDYFIDKKVPQRMRDSIPVLAVGNQILAVANIEIADSLKITEDTRRYYKINYDRDLM